MKTARVQLYGITGKYVVVNTDATAGATVGSDLKWPDGSTVTEAQLRAATTPPTGSASDISTSDDLDEGSYNLYFTQQRAQDAVGGILTDTPTIDFTYDGAAHFIQADLKPSGVSAGIYGDAAHIPRLTVDQYGRVTAASVVALTPSFVPYFVPTGTVFVVPLNAQALWTIPIELEGTAGLEIDGALVEVN